MKPETRDYILLFLLNISLLLYHAGSFLRTENLAGRDLVGAYSLVESFGFEWSTRWFVGFPMFQFYPPGFSGTVKILGTAIGDLTAFKLLVFSSTAFFPLAVYYSFSSLYNRETGFIAGLLGVSLVFLREPFSLIYQTLQVGLVAQSSAFLTFLLLVGVLWRESRGSSYLSAVLLGMTVLLHPFVGALSVLYVLIYFVLEGKLYRTLMALTGIALSGWWTLPALEHLWYVQNYVGATGQFVNWPWLFIPFLLLNRSRKALSLSLLGLLLLFLGTFNLGLEFQFYRFYIYGQIITVLSSAPGIKNAFDRLDRIDNRSLVAVLAISVIVPGTATDIEPHWESNVSLEGVVPDEGRTLVETSHNDLYNSYVPVQEIPLRSNASVVNGLYADGSISSPYLLGLEKSVAEDPVPNPLAVKANLNREQIKDRMRYFNISRAVVRTEHARRRLGFMELEAENEDFKLLSWHPRPDYRIRAARICIPREEWRDFNRFIFRNDLETSVIRNCTGGERINYTGSESIIDSIEEMKKKPVNLTDESIKPEGREEGVFHLETE